MSKIEHEFLTWEHAPNIVNLIKFNYKYGAIKYRALDDGVPILGELGGFPKTIIGILNLINEMYGLENFEEYRIYKNELKNAYFLECICENNTKEVIGLSSLEVNIILNLVWNIIQMYRADAEVTLERLDD